MSSPETVSPSAFTTLLKTLAVAFQVGLVIVVIEEFSLISRSFLELSILTLGGFIIHALLPQRFRLHFFLLLSLAALLLVMGVVPTLWILGLGAGLLGIALAPLSYRVRVAALLIAGGVLLYMRGPSWEGPIPGAVWPILGSIFMFRLVILVYDLNHTKERPPLKWILSYIFMLPNPCFPLFPVVDFKKMQTSYYSAEPFSIYQRGAKWLYRGTWQLILYRLVYTRFTIDAVDVDSATGFIQFALSSFLLYLRVSGQFHLIVGMLLLFGFNLPETHHRYYLASSFNDFWRRINIYWKDFMMKLFYYPAYFQLRRFGDKTALVGATIFVFLSTWFLHLYQWYWLRGTALLEWHDVMFWAVLGMLVVWNSLHEVKHGRERTATWATRSAWGNAALVCRTAATFVAICLLWSMWTAESLTQWIELIRAAGSGAVPILLTAPVLYALGSWLSRRDRMQPQETRKRAGLKVVETPFWRAAFVNATAALLLAALGSPAVYSYLGNRPAKEIADLAASRLNQRDLNRLERGYYEQLMGANPQSSELWEIYDRQPVDWVRLHQTEIWRAHNENILLGDLYPNKKIMFKNGWMQTNRWGMRDGDYELEKPADTYRIAVVGSSHVMGSGVNDGETFEQVIEERLNLDPGARPFPHYEVLNFAVAARSDIQHLFVLEQRILPFEPDALLVVAHGQDLGITLRVLSQMIRSGVEVPYPYLKELFASEGLDQDTPDFIIRRRLKPHAAEALQWAYEQMAEICRAHGVEPIWVYLPMVYDPPEGVALDKRLQEAEEAGYSTVSLADVYAGHDEAELQVAPWDNHPNARAHELVADLLYKRLSDGVLGRSLLAAGGSTNHVTNPPIAAVEPGSGS